MNDALMDHQADDIINKIKIATGDIKILWKNEIVYQSVLFTTLRGLGLVQLNSDINLHSYHMFDNDTAIAISYLPHLFSDDYE